MWPLLLVREAHMTQTLPFWEKKKNPNTWPPINLPNTSSRFRLFKHDRIVFFRCRVLKNQEEYTEVNNGLFLCLEATTET